MDQKDLVVQRMIRQYMMGCQKVKMAVSMKALG